MCPRRLMPALLVSAALLTGCDRADPAPPVAGALTPAPTAPAETLPSAPGADTLQAEAIAPVSTGPHLPPAGRVGWMWLRPGEQLGLDQLPDDVTLIGLDGLSTKPAQVAALKERGIYTICRLNLTTFDPQSPDADLFTPQMRRSGAGLDLGQATRPGSALGVLLTRRLGACVVRGFDAVDPGDLGGAGRTEDARARQQRLNFAGWLADQAHAAGLAILQHGALRDQGQRDEHGRVLADIFDGALSRNCQAEESCGALIAYVNRGKLALDLAAPGTGLDCQSAERLGINQLGAGSSVVRRCD